MEESGCKHDDLDDRGKRVCENILCQPCYNDGDNVTADGYCETCNEHLCSVCLKVHRKQSATKNHVIKSKDVMPRVQMHTDPCSGLCSIHKTDIVKFYCHFHDEVGCGDCMILEHKVCTVRLVPDVSGNYGSSDEPWEIKHKMEQLLKEIVRRKEEVKSNMAVAAEMNMKVVQEIKQFRSDLNSYLDCVEGELLRKAEQLKSQNDCLLNKWQHEYMSMETELKELQSSLERQSEKINQLFVTVKVVKKKVMLFQRLNERFETDSQISIYNFEPSQALTRLKEQCSQMGKLPVTIRKRMVYMKTTFERKLNLKASNEKDCWITGMAKLSGDDVLLADCENRCLKVLNFRENKITSKYSLPGYSEPWDVTVISQNTAAATVPRIEKILFMNTLNTLSESHSLKVRKRCRGIDYRNHQLAVSFCFPSAVQILNIKGYILHEVNDTSMFGYPGHIAMSINGRSIYVSDCYEKAVFELSIDGKLKAITENCMYLTKTRGLTVTSDGTIIVCCEDSSDMLTMIVPNTREILPLTLKHVQKPASILVCENLNKIFVSEDRSSAACNSIKVFDTEL